MSKKRAMWIVLYCVIFLAVAYIGSFVYFVAVGRQYALAAGLKNS
jgi:hypothetical protein